MFFVFFKPTYHNMHTHQKLLLCSSCQNAVAAQVFQIYCCPSQPTTALSHGCFMTCLIVFVTHSWQLPYYARIVNEVEHQMNCYRIPRASFDDVAMDVFGSCGYKWSPGMKLRNKCCHKCDALSMLNVMISTHLWSRKTKS